MVKLFGVEVGSWGTYPKEYDPAVHGRYNPATYYGKADSAFMDVKVKDIGSWFARREKGPIRFAQMMSRVYWRWQQNYVLPKKAGIAPLFQVIVGSCIFFYIINYPKLRFHASKKYH